jgi:hypothetical protein
MDKRWVGSSWRLWRREKSLASVGDQYRFLGFQSVAQTLYRLSKKHKNNVVG